MAKLRAVLGVELAGDKGNNGLLSKVSAGQLAVGDLQKKIDARKDSLDELNKPVVAAQSQVDSGNKLLETKKAERAKLQEQLKAAAEGTTRRLFKTNLIR